MDCVLLSFRGNTLNWPLFPKSWAKVADLAGITKDLLRSATNIDSSTDDDD